MSMAGLPQGAQGQPNMAQLIKQMAQQNAGGNAPQPGQPGGMATNPQSTQGPPWMQDAIKNLMQQRQQGQTSRKAKSMTRQRGMNDPKRAFGALSKLTKNMNPQQLQQLQQGMGNIFGQNFGGLGAGNQAAEAFGNIQTPKQQMEQLHSTLNKSGAGNKMGTQAQAGNFRDVIAKAMGGMGKNQAQAGNQIHQLMANMGMTGPGSGMRQWANPTRGGPMPQPGQPPTIGAPPMAGGTTPTLPGGPSGPMQPPMGQPPMGGPMPGGPGVMGQPSMPGGMQPPVRVNNPGTFFGGQQPQQPQNPHPVGSREWEQAMMDKRGMQLPQHPGTFPVTPGGMQQPMPQQPQLNPGGMQGPMGMQPPMNFTPPAGSPAATGQPRTPGQPPAASLPAFNNPQYGGMGIR